MGLLGCASSYTGYSNVYESADSRSWTCEIGYYNTTHQGYRVYGATRLTESAAFEACTDFLKKIGR